MICDNTGTELAELTDATARTITYQRNSYAEAVCTIQHEDAAASLLLNALNTGIPTLKAWRRAAGETTATLRFNGHLAPFSEQAEETATLDLVFRSPFARLLGDGTGQGRYTAATVTFTAQDAGAIAQTLIETTNALGATGLIIGTVNTTVVRDRTYQYANVGDSIINLSRVINGFDFDETFLDYGTTLAQFNVYASQGNTQLAARFEYGPDTMANVRSMSRTTQPPVNQATVLGANGLSSVAQDTASITAYGLWEVLQSQTDVSEQATLDEKAEALLRPAPIKTVEFAPDFTLENAPRPWDDFWLGDTVTFYARRDALTENVAVRVNGIKVVIDDNGLETFETSSPDVPEDEPDIKAEVQVEVV